jgi:Tfp pilus assembly protein PilF
MNRRTKRRLIVLVALVGGVAVAGVGGTIARKVQRAQMAERSLAEGLAAYEAGEYKTAISKLRTHLRIAGEDARAMTALGDAHRYVEEPNFKHLLTARNFLETAVALDPGNTRAREVLLDVHAQLGNWTELAQVAGALLETDPTNIKAARLRIEANLRRGDAEAALRAAREFVIAQDGAIEAHIEMLRAMQGVNRNTREQREYLESEVAPQHEGTTSMAVLRAMVEFDGDQHQRAAEYLLQAGKAGATDGPGARMLLESLELIAATTGNRELYGQSNEWLAQWLEDEAIAPHIYEVAAGRAWRSGQSQRAFDYASRAVGTEPESEAVFAWGLLGAMEMGMEGDQAVSRLREAFDASIDPEFPERANRWRELIDAAARLARGEPASDTPLIGDIDRGINTLGPDGVGIYYDALGDAGRYNTQDAIDRLAALGQQPSWGRATITLANVLQGNGRSAEAYSVLRWDEALKDLPGSAELMSDVFASVMEQLGTEAGPRLASLEALLAEQPQNPMLLSAIGRGALVLGETERAIDVARQLSASQAAEAAISAVRFARALQPIDAQLAEEIIDRIAVTATTPRQVSAAAIGLAGLGLHERARELIEARAQEGLGGTAFDWNLARIQLATVIGDAQGVETLEQISAANAGDARVHIEILNGPTIWTDLDRTGQVVARLREAQGDAAIEWRIFEAQRLLQTNDSQANADAATAVLGPVIQNPRGKRDTRAMLLAADAFERIDSTDSQLQALEFAADGNDPVAALPRLIGRLQDQGQSSKAGTRLGQFLALQNIPIDALAVRAQLLQRQGMHEQAAQDIEAIARAGYPQYVLRAGVLARPRGTEKPLTEEELRSLAAELRPQGQVYAAQLLARVGRFDEGLARLESLPADSEVGSRAVVVARYLSDEGQPDRALEYLIEQAEATGDADAWMEAARLLVGQLRVDEAWTLLGRAAAALPGNAAIAAFRASIDPDSDAAPFDRMAQFTASAAERDDASEGMKDLGAIAKAYTTGQADATQTAQALDELAGRNATLYPVWPLLVAVYQKLDQPEEAARRARDSMTALPGDPRPARDTAQLFIDLGRFEEALGAASRWRSLATDPKSQAEADMALGVSEYQRGNADRAVGLLAPLTERMLADTASYERPLLSLGEALTAADRMAQAEELLMPLARGHAGWASFMASVSVIAPSSPSNTDRATRWLETLTPVLAGDAQGTADIATAWMTLFDRTGDVAYADRVIALAESAGRAGADSWRLEAIRATALEARGEHSQAVTAYERSMELAGARVPALLNNAAWLLTTELGEHARAVALAQEAVTSSAGPGHARSDRATYHHTLGSAQLGAGDAAAALRTFEDGLQLAPSPSLQLGRVEALLAANRRTEAGEAYARLRPDAGWSDSHRSRYETLGERLGSG